MNSKRLESMTRALESQFEKMQISLSDAQIDSFKIGVRYLEDIYDIIYERYKKLLRDPVALPWEDSGMDLLWRGRDYFLLMVVQDPDSSPEYIFYNRVLHKCDTGKL